MNNGYAICFNEWALDKEIKNELGLLLIISSLTAEKGYCYASNKYLSELFEVPEETISRKLKILKEKGYITIQYEKCGCEVKNRYIRLTKMLIDDYQKCQSTINKNVKENNISNNIISNNNNDDDNNKINNKNIFDFFEENLGRTLAPIEFEKIKQWEIDYNRELIDEALKRAIMNNKKNLNYINAILINWKTQGYNSLQEVKDNDINHFKESSNNKNIELFDYNWFEDEEIDD